MKWEHDRWLLQQNTSYASFLVGWKTCAHLTTCDYVSSNLIRMIKHSAVTDRCACTVLQHRHAACNPLGSTACSAAAFGRGEQHDLLTTPAISLCIYQLLQILNQLRLAHCNGGKSSSQLWSVCSVPAQHILAGFNTLHNIHIVFFWRGCNNTASGEGGLLSPATPLCCALRPNRVPDCQTASITGAMPG